jgi:hypothetical protein
MEEQEKAKEAKEEEKRQKEAERKIKEQLNTIEADKKLIKQTEEEFERIFNCLDTIFSKHN